ncbi:MAG: sugar phosphate nucleotidyltransferase, partial [Gammaproteobacteria bacterium]|nr:sugar phosphate nucleotidyltransferase [Gammaproteobacteria bacterium]
MTRAILLSAGRGERLRPLTDAIPKPLVPVNGKPLIVYHLEKLSAIGIKDVVINISYLADQIRDALGDGKKFDL